MRNTLGRGQRRLPASIAIVLYTLTMVLVPPWLPFVHAMQQQVVEEYPPPPPLPPPPPEEKQLVYTGEEVVTAAGWMGDVHLDRRQQSNDNEDGRESFQELNDGVPFRMNLEWGQAVRHQLSAEKLFGDAQSNELRPRDGELAERQTDRRAKIYLTFNTCLQPERNRTARDGGGDSNGRHPAPPPSLRVFVSNSSQNQSPGPDAQNRAQRVVPVDQGYGALELDATSDVYVGVFAPDLANSQRNAWQEVWNYELTLSTKEPYHRFIDDQFLYLVDTDDSSALLITGNMTTSSSKFGGMDETKSTEELLASPPPYRLYAQNHDTTSRLSGLEKSYCAVSLLAPITNAVDPVGTSMTTRGLGHFPKQQFHIRELNRSSTYSAMLARSYNDSTTAGTLWRAIRVDTKRDGNCQLIYNLNYCDEVAYAVPSNPTLFSGDNRLAQWYDDIAESWAKNFTYSLQQFQCNASSPAAYSLVRNCDDCMRAYKNWLCAVTIPRCMDFSSNLPYLAERSTSKLFWNDTAKGWQQAPLLPVITNAKGPNATEVGSATSRNRRIDEDIRPGQYKEVKPCKDLCWSLVQDCPPSLGFTCPVDGSWGMKTSYGERDGNGDVTCSYLGAAYFLSGANRAPWAARGLLWGFVGLWVAWWWS